MTRQLIRKAEAFVGFSEEVGYSVGVCLESSDGKQSEAYVSDRAYRSNDPAEDKKKVAADCCRANEFLMPEVCELHVGDLESLEAKIDSYFALAPEGKSVCAALSYAFYKLAASCSNTPLEQMISLDGTVVLPGASCLSTSGSGRYGTMHLTDDRPEYYFIVPNKGCFADAAYILWETMHAWEQMLTKRFHIRFEHGSGMFIPSGMIESDEQLLELMTAVIKESGHADAVGIGLALAPEEYCSDGRYQGLFDPTIRSKAGVIAYLEKICREYPVVYLDLEGWDQTDLTDIGPETKVFTYRDSDEADGTVIRLRDITKISELQKRCRQLKRSGKIISFDDTLTGNIDAPKLAAGLGAWILKGYGLSKGGNSLIRIERSLI